MARFCVKFCSPTVYVSSTIRKFALRGSPCRIESLFKFSNACLQSSRWTGSLKFAGSPSIYSVTSVKYSVKSLVVELLCVEVDAVPFFSTSFKYLILIILNIRSENLHLNSV
jgi:hypothetical protein